MHTPAQRCDAWLSRARRQTDLVVPYTGAQLRHWLCEGTAAGVGVDAGDAACDGSDAPAALRRVTAAQRVRCDEDAPLRDLMAAPAHVIPSTLVLFVVARGSKGRERFLAGKW